MCSKRPLSARMEKSTSSRVSSASRRSSSTRTRTSDRASSICPKVTPIDVFETAAERSHGEVHVVSRVVGFKKIKFYTNENVGSGELDLPEQQMHTTAYWLTIPSAVMNGLPYAADDRRDGIVGLSFALKQIAQLLLMCDGHDVGIAIEGAERDVAPDRSPRVFVYD